jgi:hypothetical protein
MSPVTSRVKAFFDRWEQITNALDVEQIVALYADPFMFAGPGGVRMIDRRSLAAALPRRRDFFTSVGHTSTRVVSLEETALDDHYTMVRVEFFMRFEGGASRVIDANVGSVFILRFANDPAQIVFHLEHQDLQQAMQEYGLMPR